MLITTLIVLKMCDLPIINIFKGHESLLKDAISKLPENFRPTAVSKKVEEVRSMIDGDDRRCLMSEFGHCEFEEQLFTVIHSPEFLRAILNIMKHTKQEVGDNTRQHLQNKLSALENYL